MLQNITASIPQGSHDINATSPYRGSHRDVGDIASEIHRKQRGGRKKPDGAGGFSNSIGHDAEAKKSGFDMAYPGIPTSSPTKLTQSLKGVLLNHYITWNSDKPGLKANVTFLVTSLLFIL